LSPPSDEANPVRKFAADHHTIIRKYPRRVPIRSSTHPPPAYITPYASRNSDESRA
jgi:hypothetical protein